MSFTGIPLAALDFYEDLENDNSKPFWTANKEIYDESVRAPLLALAAELAAEFGAAKLFRPFRDVRFAKDKTPYKTQQGVYFAESRVYLQVSAAGLFVGAGVWQTSPEQVARLRRAVDDERHGPALAQILTTAKQRGLVIAGEQLTRVPSGFAKDHPRADLLTYKSLTAHRDLGAPDWLPTPAAKAEIVDVWRQADPLLKWLSDYVV